MKPEQEKALERELELYHTTFNDDQRDFLKKRGFEIVHGPPYSPWAREEDDNHLKRLERPYFFITEYSLFKFESHADGRGGKIGYIIDPSAQSAESLAGLIEMCVVDLKGRDSYSFAPHPEGQGFLVYVETPGWDPVWDILVDRWGGKK